MRRVVELPSGIWHLAAGGECTWFEFASAIFEEAGIECRVRPISTAELGRPAPRPAYSVLRSERPGAPRLPHWREGLRDCLPSGSGPAAPGHDDFVTGCPTFLRGCKQPRPSAAPIGLPAAITSS